MKKTLVLLAMMLVTRVGYPCQAEPATFNYQDYIYGVNDCASVNQVVTSEDTTGLKTTYTIYNNEVVDLPLTVFVKMTSNTKIGTGGDHPEMINAKLQYRVLGKSSSSDSTSKWVTVRELSKPQGTISMAASPAAYLGRNNIDPIGIQEGDVIMIRYYVTDGIEQNGVLTDKCTGGLGTQTVSGKSYYTLPNTYNYTYAGAPINDLGNGWMPHFVKTVIWSGKRRPIK